MNKNAVRPKGPMARAAALRAGVANAQSLREVADVLERDIDTSTLVFGHVEAARLRLLADTLDAVAKAEPASVTLAQFQSMLNDAATRGANITFSAGEAEALLAALRHEASDTVHRLSKAGIAAAAAQNDAETWMNKVVEEDRRHHAQMLEASHLIDEQRLEINRMWRTVGDLAEQVEEAESNGGDTNIMFVFSNSNDPAGMGVEAAMELVMLLEELRG